MKGKLSGTLKKGDKICYPSSNGVALICEIRGESKLDFLVGIENRTFFIPKTSVDAHAIVLKGDRARIFVTQQFVDEDNSLVYIRHRYNETLMDRLYNWYCRWKGRDVVNAKPVKAKTLTFEIELEDPS